MPKIIWIAAAIILIGWVGASQRHKGGSSHRAVSPPVVVPHASYELIASQSSCQENPGTAYVNCSIGVRNIGDVAGLPDVYVTYLYSDGGTSVDSNAFETGQVASDPIRPHQLGYVYFSHPYKATTHDLVQAAASLDENAAKMPYIRVARPTDTNWPD